MPEAPGEEEPQASFEQSLAELEKVVRDLEAGDVPLERAMALFEKGVELSRTCRRQLQEAETRVEMLLKKNGKIEPEPARLNQE